MKPYLIILLSVIGILICLSGIYCKLIAGMFKKHWREILSLGVIVFFFFRFNSDVLLKEKFRVLHDNWIHAYPLFHYFNDSIVQTGAMPYWNPYIDGGQPTFWSLNHYFLFHLPHLIAYLIYPFIYKHVSTLLLYWWVIIISNLLFSLGCYFLFRILFSNWKASLFGFIVCLFSGITVGTLHQEQIMASSFYIPWAWGGLIIFFRTKKVGWGILSSILIGMSLINHNPHLIVYFWGILSVSFLVIRWSDFRRMWRTSWKQWLLMIAIGIPIILIIASPTFVLYGEYKALVVSPYHTEMGEKIAVSYDYLVRSKDTNSMGFNTLLHYIFPKTYFDLSLLQYFKNFSLDGLIFYIGLLPLFFAVYELFRGTSSLRKVYALSAAIMFFFALGPNSYGYYLLYKIVPFANLQRLPIHLGNYINLFLILLAVSGVKTFLEQKTYPESNCLSTPKVIFFMAMPVIYQPLSDALMFFTPYMRHQLLIETVILLSVLIIFLLAVFRLPSKLAIIIIFLVLLFDVTKYYRNVLPKEQDSRKTGFNYYSAESTWKDYKSLFYTLKLETPYLALLNKEPVIDINNNSLLVFSEYRKFIKQYKPLLADSIKNREMYRVVQVIPEGQIDIFKRVGPSMFLSNSIPSNTEVKVKSYQPNEVQFEANVEEPAYLYYMDNYDKGWSVYVNGNKKDLIKIFSFKAVELMKGENRIVFSYKPSWCWVLHASLSVFWSGLGGCLIYIYWQWIKKQRKPISTKYAACS